MGKWAAVGIGTNSIYLLVANVAPGEAPVPLVREEQIVRLASGLSRHRRLTDDAITNIASIVWRYQRAARRYGVELNLLVGSALLRQADNREALAARLQQVIGMPLQVLAPEEEAEASYRAVVTTYARAERVLGTCNIEGARTELTATAGVRLAPEVTTHLPVGSRNLMQRFGLHLPTPAPTWTAVTTDLIWGVSDPARAMRPRPTFAVVLGGGAEALVQMRLQASALRLARGAPVEGAILSQSWLESAADRLRMLDVDERAALPGIPPDRADTITANAAILLAVLQAWDLTEIAVTERNLLDGLVPDQFPG